MKIRSSFVSNSSSCSFVIENLSDSPRTLADFVEENPQLVEQFNKEYMDVVTLKDLLYSAENENIEFPPLSGKICVFGDEQGTLIGRVFDYILRDGGYSTNFRWSLHEMLR